MCSKGFSENDLINMINILEVCTKRGAFHASELSGVGQLYDKLKECRSVLNETTSDKCVGSCDSVSGNCNVDENVVEEEQVGVTDKTVCDNGNVDECCQGSCQGEVQGEVQGEEQGEEQGGECDNCPQNACDNCPLREENYDTSGLTSKTINV